MIRKIFNTVCAVALTLAVVGCSPDPTIDGTFDGFAQQGPGILEDGTIPLDPTLGPGETTLGGPPAKAAGTIFQALGEEFQVWPNIYFARNKYFIGAAEEGKLDKLANYLIQNPTLHVLIAGHCSTRGSEEFNKSLSEKRALVAQDYLIGKGVAAANVSTVAYGEEKPEATGSTEEAHAKNRRDEFTIGQMK